MTTDDFDVTLLTGYLDGELTQSDAQRVRLHLEDCAECRAELDEMRALAEATRSTTYVVPTDLQWDETPRSASSRRLNVAGLTLAALGALGIVVAVIWGLVDDGDGSNPIAVAVVALFVASALLVVASALLDRLAVRDSDPYRKVKR